MTSRLTKSILALSCALAGPAFLAATPAAAQTVQRPSGEVVLSIGRGQLVTTSGRMADVFVANEAIADVQIKSTNQLYLFGKAGGETTVYASDAAGRVIWSANVRVGSNIESVDQMLTLAMPDAKIAVSTIGNGTYLLTGTVASPEDAAEAQRLVAAYVGKEANIITRLKTATPLQVNLQVRFAEVSRSLLRQLNSSLSSIDGTGGFKFGIANGRRISPAWTTDPNLPLGMGSSTSGYTIDPVTGAVVSKPGSTITPADGLTTIGGMGRFLGLNLIGALDAGETVGLVTTLSQLNLTAISGETASFLAGGEYPIPMSQGLGATSVDYKQYGVSLGYTPTVLANGRISLRVKPEVSELSSQGSVQLNGFTIPALTTRRTETTIELGSGQSFMIAGLMSNNAQNTIQKLPGAGDLPILGSLFRSTSFRKGETELVIVVTPYLVNPVNANDIKLPTDGFNAPDALQQILGNQLSAKGSADRPKPSAAEPVAPNPAVGALDAPVAPAADKPARSAKRAASAAPAPGFALD